MYNGYITSAKINATKENHNRIRDFVAASFTKCAAGSSYITLNISSRSTGNVNCNYTMSNLSLRFTNHFYWGGFKNPYKPSEGCCNWMTSQSPPKGKTYIRHSGNAIRITTNVGTDSGGNDYLRSMVAKE